MTQLYTVTISTQHSQVIKDNTNQHLDIDTMVITWREKFSISQTTVLCVTKIWTALTPTTITIIDKKVTVVSTDNAAEAYSTATTTATTTTTTITTTAASTATATIRQMVTKTKVTATTEIIGTFIKGNHIKWPIHPNFSNSSQLDQQYQHSKDQNSQIFSGSNNRHQNYTCSNNQPSSWIRPHILLQAIPVTVFSETVSIETYTLLDSGGDHTQITKTIAEALGNRVSKSVKISVASQYKEHTIETTEIFHGIGVINNSRPIFILPVLATSTTDFQMPTMPIQMLNSIWKDFGQLGGIIFSQIRDNRIGIMIGTDAFTATVPLKYTIGPPGTPYGVLTHLESQTSIDKFQWRTNIIVIWPCSIGLSQKKQYWKKTCSNYFGHVNEQAQQKGLP